LVVAVLALWADGHNFVHHFPILGAVVPSLNVVMLILGYYVPSLMRLGHRVAIAIGMEAGVQNGTLAIAIALSPLVPNTPPLPCRPASTG
jgi:bile acid:Na+ symporter, BASS family